MLASLILGFIASAVIAASCYGMRNLPLKYVAAGSAVLTVLTTAGVAAAALAIPAFVSGFAPSIVENHRDDLVSMTSAGGRNNIFLERDNRGSGGVHYLFLIRKGDGSLAPQQIDGSEMAAIAEDKTLNNLGYVLVRCTMHDTKTWLSLVSPILPVQGCGYTFQVPAGSVSHN